MKPIDHEGSFNVHYRWCVSACDEAQGQKRLVGSDLQTYHRFWSDYGLLGSWWRFHFQLPDCRPLFQNFHVSYVLYEAEITVRDISVRADPGGYLSGIATVTARGTKPPVVGRSAN
jgi:hypothetical protein